MPFSFEHIQELPGVVVVTPQIFKDSRGSFQETYRQSEFSNAGITTVFKQDNHSVSSKGTLRGIHFQNIPYAQSKLVRVTEGRIFDVVVDVRPKSDTYLQWYGVELSNDNGKMLYIPAGYGHAFLALEDVTQVHYKCSEEYNQNAESGLRWDDPQIGILWPFLKDVKFVVSDKDSHLPLSEII